MPEIRIVKSSTSERRFVAHGGAREFWFDMSPEQVIGGPAETGKTRVALEKVNMLLSTYPKVRALMCRKSLRSLYESAVVTLDRHVLGAYDDEGEFQQDKTPVRKIGGETPSAYQYPNGSRLVLGGLDKPGKVLSAEYDVIYVPQAEEIALLDWETLTTRATGRAGNLPFGGLVLGDANPGPPSHWIKQREREGKLSFHEGRHQDNPVLFDHIDNEWTVQGKRSLRRLDALTGVTKERLRYGRWVAAEGAVYPTFDKTIHVIPAFDIPGDWPRFRVIDFGLVNPFVCQWWALDGDRRAYMYREIYKTGRTVAQHAAQIKSLSIGEKIITTICDTDAEDRLTLSQNGIPNIPAYKSVKRGIEAVQRRLAVQEDGKPRLFLFKSALVEIDQELLVRDKPVPTCTEDEVESYIWMNPGKKEAPVKENDHGVDAIRYFICHIDKLAPLMRRKSRKR